MIQKVRRQGIIFRNIQSDWRTTRLLPYNLDVVFQKLSIYANDTSASDIDTTRARSNTPL